MSRRDLIRLREVRRADVLDDQKPASQIANAVPLSEDQEQFQAYLLSQVKRIIYGDNAGLWNADFRGQGIPSLAELAGDVADGPALERLTFTHASPATTLLQALAPGQLVLRALVVVIVPFDGTGPTLRLGTSADVGIVLDASDVDLRRIGQYETDVVFPVDTADNFQLQLSAPSATQGQGLLLYEITR